MFHHADDHGPGGRAPGLSDQAVPGTLAGEGSPVCRPYGETHHPTGDKGQGDRTGAGRHARKRAAELFGAGVGAVNHWVRTYREGGMAALRPKNRNAGQASKPAMRRSRNARAVGDDVEALRRRVEEPELENALMREAVEVAEKDPGADLWRLSNREKTLPVDRPRPTYSPGSMTCLPGIAPGSRLLPPRQARR